MKSVTRNLIIIIAIVYGIIGLLFIDMIAQLTNTDNFWWWIFNPFSMLMSQIMQGQPLEIWNVAILLSHYLYPVLFIGLGLILFIK